MNGAKYWIHVVCLFIIQLTILDNIQLHSYVYINIYILAILVLPYGMKKLTMLFLAFLFGLIVDLANNTMGIHAAATTFLAYIRPRLLQLTFNREPVDEMEGTHKMRNLGWFLKYTSFSVLAYNVVLILAEAFTFANINITFMRILCSSIVSYVFILLYYFIAIKKKQE